MKLSATIMAHPSRKKFVAELKRDLDRPIRATWDRDNSLWETGRRALLAHGAKATHHLVIQDDAIVCRDLLAGVEAALPHLGNRPMSLYAGMYRPSDKAAVIGRAKERMAQRVEQASEAATPWFAYEGPWWGVAIVVPVADIPALVEYGDAWTRGRNYDARIGQFYIDRGIDCLYAMPSLVDHRPATESPSIIGNDIHMTTETGRCAHEFIGRERSALDIDWSVAPLEMPRSAVRVDPLEALTGGEPFDVLATDREAASVLASLPCPGSRWTIGVRPLNGTIPIAKFRLNARLSRRPKRLLVVGRDADLPLAGRRPAVSAEELVRQRVVTRQLQEIGIEVNYG